MKKTNAHSNNLTRINVGDISLSINPHTRTISLKQGDDVIEMTRDQVIGLRKLKNREFETNVYTAQVFPHNTFKLLPSGIVTVDCKESFNSASLTLNAIACKSIAQFTENNKGRIAWDRDIKRR